MTGFLSVAQSCPTLCDPMECSMPCFPITNFWTLLKLMSVMPPNHLIPCHPLLLPPSYFSSMMVFSKESVCHIMWPHYWSFQFQYFNEYSGLISFSVDLMELCAVQGSQESSLTPQFKSINSLALSFL